MNRIVLSIAAVLITTLLTGCQEVQNRSNNSITRNSIAGKLGKLAENAGAEERGVVAMLDGKIKTSLDNDMLDSLYDDLWTIPQTYTTRGLDILSEKPNLTALLLAAGGSIALRSSTTDGRIAEEFKRNPSFRHKWSDEGLAIVGGPGFHFAAAGLWYALAHNSKNELNKVRSWKMIEALSITSITTFSLKLAISDHTPNGKFLAWPSGHTASSFTVAAVLDEYYGHDVGTIAYLGAGLVAYRMMDSGDHWASDVLFGMVLGHIVGHQVAGSDDFDLAGFKVLPFTGSADNGTKFGLSLVKTF